MNYELVLATNNAHKLKEVREILSPYGIKVYGLNDLSLQSEDVEENSNTYYGNALIKATSVAKLTKLPVIADDSGLEIEAMDNKPGLHSARFANECGGHQKAIEKILSIVNDNRNARFICDIVLLNEENKPILFEGIVKGKIAYQPYGQGGFGYDPIFICEATNKTYAEMGEEEKNKYSHRGTALQKLIDYLLEKKKISR